MGGLAVSPDTIFAADFSDPTRTIEMLSTHWEKRSFSWQSARIGYDLLRVSEDAFGSDPVADAISVVGVAITFPITVVAVPYDAFAFPFRWNEILKVRLRGKLIDSSGLPVRSEKVVVIVQAKYPRSDLVGREILHEQFECKSDAEGDMELPIDLSFGPNSDLELSVTSRGMAQYYWIVKESGKIRVIDGNAGGTSLAKLAPLPSQKPH